MLPSHSATSPPHPVCPQAPETKSNSQLKLSSINIQKKKKEKKKAKQGTFISSISNDGVDTAADCTFRVAGACLIIAEKTDGGGEREREKGKQGGRERLLAHSVTTMRLSAALSREHGLPGSACKWLQPPSIRSPSAPIIQQMPLPTRRLLRRRLLSGAAVRRGRGGPCQPPEPRPLVLSPPVSPTTAPAAHYITAGESLLPAPPMLHRGCCTEPAAVAGDAMRCSSRARGPQ